MKAHVHWYRKEGRRYLQQMKLVAAGPGGMLVCWLLLLWGFWVLAVC
ncbi:hypothetical protein LDR44_004665 [Salmonella enterica]|nr:hypothetical protein [Salmonella enterica]EFR3658192.1 hypothetical protein [Salmonella enterica]EIE7706050.1 hypothetical protein [Salmonella enterica]EIN2108375.1 hypothetical protein [Salmonella enterica]EIO8764927.1 hypothetical protein [Salmonella enterica]